MALIGFAALIIVAFLFIKQGIGINLFSRGFTGEWSIMGICLIIVGGIIGYIAFQNAPFAISMVP